MDALQNINTGIRETIYGQYIDRLSYERNCCQLGYQCNTDVQIHTKPGVNFNSHVLLFTELYMILVQKIIIGMISMC